VLQFPARRSRCVRGNFAQRKLKHSNSGLHCYK